MARNTAQSGIAYAASSLNDAQRAHLGDLEAKRRRMVDIRRGRAAAPGALEARLERELDDLRTAGRLDANQELFLRLCGPEEIERQHALHRFFGARYEGVIVPSLRNLRDERRTQKHGVQPILRAYQRERMNVHGVRVGGLGRNAQRLARVRRLVRHLRRHRSRRVVRRPAGTRTASGSDGSSDPPGGGHNLSATGGVS